MSLKDGLASVREKLIAAEKASRKARKAAKEADQALAEFHEAAKALVVEHGEGIGLDAGTVTALSGNEGKD